MKNTAKSLITEYGIKWLFNRSLYAGKLKLMSGIPATEKLFEHKTTVKRVDIFTFDVEAISSFLQKLNDNKKAAIVTIADKAAEGIITGFSALELDYGNPINWHLNPLTDTETDRNLKWYRIPDFDPKMGDIKVIWEASRLTHFLFFSRAYLLTKNEKYYHAFSEQLDDWLNQNRYSYGANYKCGQEATLRMINVLMADAVFRQCGLTGSQDKKNVIQLVEASYRKIRANFFYAHRCIKNNHTFTEILGQIVGAWCSGEAEKIAEGYGLMDQEIRSQFNGDGGFTQHSFNYHRFVLQILACLHKSGEKTGQSITETERILNSVLLLYQVQEENGDLPNYGSNDGALVFPLTSCDYRDFRPVLNTMHALLQGKRLYKSGDYDEELLWFGSNTGIPKAAIQRTASAFSQSGYYTLRHGEGFLMVCLQEYRNRPGHMDQLHVDLWHRNVNIFCDSGSYSYADQLGEELSSTAGHNTVKLPGMEQMNRMGTFMLSDWTQRKSVKHSDASFTGEMISQNGYCHTRTIHQTEEGYLIQDSVLSEFPSCEFNFLTPCEVKIDKDGFSLYADGQHLASVMTDCAIEVYPAYRSLYYLQKDPIWRIAARKTKQANEDSLAAVFHIHLATDQ